MKKTIKYVIAAVAVAAMASCSQKKFHVEGQITNAKDSVLYFENISLTGPVVLDSVRLGDTGDFSFSGEQTEAPEFYRLRISDQIISLSIDSTETVTVKGAYPQMASNYEVTGSENCAKIKELALKQMDLQQRAIAVSRSQQLTVDEVNDSILSMIDRYKQEVKKQYIFAEPGKAYSYFALFQTLGNMLLFNPGDIDGLSKQLQRMIGDNQLQEKIAKASKLFAQTKFSITYINQQLEHIYSELS